MDPSAQAFPASVGLEISLLGPLTLRRDAHVIELRPRKAQALLAYLASQPGKAHEREAIQALLWATSAKKQAQGSLRQALRDVRATLSRHAPLALQANGTSISLGAAQVRVDLVALERAIAIGTHQALTSIPTLCTGTFLDGLLLDEAPFDDWATRERQRLRALSIDALAKLAELESAAGDQDRAIRVAKHSLRLDFTQERTHRSLMILYAKDGRRTEAVKQYQICRTMLRDEFGVEPEDSTERVHREIRSASGSISSARVTESTPATVAQPPMVGRGNDIRQLEQMIDATWSGPSRLLLLNGDAGVGKTRLLEAAAANLQRRGCISMRGGGFESERVLPFALWTNLLRSEPARTQNALRQLPSLLRAEISRIAPTHTDVADRHAPSAGEARLVFDAVRALVNAFCEDAPVLLVLEDLHWADGMSLRLLSFLARNLGSGARVCLMATMRDEQLDSSDLLETVLQELDRERRLERASVGPLSREDTIALVRALARRTPRLNDEATFERIWAMSEGDPLVVVEAMRAHGQGKIATNLADFPVPERVRALIDSSVARLDQPCRDALAAAAVIGRPFAFNLLLQVCGVSDRVLATALEHLVAKRLLRVAGDAYYFNHDRIREVMLERVTPPRRSILHAAIARALEHLYADRLGELWGTIGYHFARAGVAADSVRCLLKFSERSMRNCGLDEALAALDEVQRQSAALAVSQRDRTAVQVAVLRARCLMYLGRIAEMEPTLAPHRSTVAQLDDPALTTSFHALAGFAHASVGDRDRTEEHDQTLSAAIERCPQGPTRGIALSQLSHGAMRMGRFQRGISQGEQAAAQLELGDDPEATAFAWINLGGNYLAVGDWRASTEAFARAVTIGERAAAPRVQAIGLAFMGVIQAVYAGDVAAGLAACRRAVRIAPDPYSAFHAHSWLVRTAAGVVNIAAVHAEVTQPVLDDAFFASKAALEVYADPSRDPAFAAWSPIALLALSDGHFALAHWEEARECAVRALAACPPDGDPLVFGHVLRALALAELALGRLDASKEHLDESLRLFNSIGARFDAAVVAFTLSGIVASQNQSLAATEYLTQAHENFAALSLSMWSRFVMSFATEHAISL